MVAPEGVQDQFYSSVCFTVCGHLFQSLGNLNMLWAMLHAFTAFNALRSIGTVASDSAILERIHELRPLLRLLEHNARIVNLETAGDIDA
jgi:hypothetical protein